MIQVDAVAKLCKDFSVVILSHCHWIICEVRDVRGSDKRKIFSFGKLFTLYSLFKRSKYLENTLFASDIFSEVVRKINRY